MRVVVLGAGSWGTTVASVVAGRHPTVLWARDPEVADEIRMDRRNSKYLPGYTLPKRLDEKVAALHLAKLGVKLTKLMKEQAEYLHVPAEGPYKRNEYRY